MIAKTNEIVWVRPDAPPGSIIEGPLQNQGFNDIALHFIMSKLHQYQHSEQIAGYERILRLMRSSNVCAVSLYKTAVREKDIVFSRPRLLVLSNGLIIRHDDMKRFAPFVLEEKVQLPSLLNDTSFVGGVAVGRLYKGIIDDNIRQLGKAEHILKRSGDNVFSDLLGMLDMQRIDYSFAFPVELTYQQKVVKFTHDMIFIPIDGMPDLTPIHVGCSRNPWGEAVIKDIDLLLERYASTEPALMQYQEWLDERQRNIYRQVTSH